MFKLAIRNIFRNTLRTTLTLAAIVTGVIAVIISGGFIEDVFVQLRESTIHSSTGHMQISQHGYHDYGQHEPFNYMINQPENVIKTVRPTPHVKTLMSRINFSGLANNSHGDLPIIGEGVEPEMETKFETAITIIEGDTLQDKDKFEAIIGEGVATALDLKPGDFITLIVSTSEGALNTLECKVVGIFRTFSKEYDDRAIRVPLQAAQELLFTSSTHKIVVLLDNTTNTDQVAELIRTKLEPYGYEVKTWLELADFYKKAVALYERQFSVLQGIILIMLVLSVSNTINMAVYERTGEFGTVLALGQYRRKIFRLILLENMLLGLLGTLLGLAIGVILAKLISIIGINMPPPPGSNTGYTASIRLIPWVLIMAISIGTLAPVLAAILPALRASRLNIVDALRYNI
tara:strand:+ start:1057 stop:2268 length:1212 start_codon:yes stop_codon:yes gene_type:complete